MFSNPFKFGKEVAFLAKYLNESPIEVGVPAETTMEAAKP